MPFPLWLITLVGVAAAGKSANVCKHFPYDVYVLVSGYPAAQQYCSSFYPVPAVTTSITTTNTFYSTATVYTTTLPYTPPANKRTQIDTQARATQVLAERDLGDIAPRATHAPELAARGRCAPWDTWCIEWQGIIAQEKQFVKTVCSCLETPVTKTSTVTASTTVVNTISTAYMCPSATPTVCNGKCANLQTDDYNCGSCGTSCYTDKGSGATCQRGNCVIACDPGQPMSYPICGNTGICDCAPDASGNGVCFNGFRQGCTDDYCYTDADCGPGTFCLASATGCTNVPPGLAGTCQAYNFDICYQPPPTKRSRPARMASVQPDGRMG